MNSRQSSAQCVKALAVLDSAFSEEYADGFRDTAEFPHAVMMLFASHLSRRFADAAHRDQSIIEGRSLIAGVLDVLEDYLRADDADVRNVITDSFIEQVYDENLWLYEHLLKIAGPFVRQEMLSYKFQGIKPLPGKMEASKEENGTSKKEKETS